MACKRSSVRLRYAPQTKKASPLVRLFLGFLLGSVLAWHVEGERISSIGRIDGIEALVVKEVAGNVGLQQGVGLAARHLLLLLSSLDTLLPCPLHQLTKHGVAHCKRMIKRLNTLIPLQLRTVLVGILKSVLVQQALVGDAVEVVFRAVVDERHIDVGHDASTAVDGLSLRAW